MDFSANSSAAAAAGGGAAVASRKRRTRPGEIKNKMKRAQVHAKQQQEKKKEKSEARRKRQRVAEELGANAPAKQVPRTLDNTREVDDTIVAPGDEEVLRDEAEDEFASYFSGEKTPKLMITTKVNPSAKIYELISEMLNVFPNSFYYKRKQYPLKKIQLWAANKGFTHLLVLSERLKHPNGMVVIHLPTGPCAAFKMSSSRHVGEIKGHGTATGHVPELILNNFTTRLGRRVGRFVGSMFPHNPEFRGRQVATFHNQRDFLFFRRHRYVFSEDGKRATLQELGPRFTLKMKWLLAGHFDTKGGEYEWFHKRHEMDTSRRKFHL